MTSRLPSTARAGRTSVSPGARLAGWADLLGPPTPESRRSRLLARIGGVGAVLALVGYLVWRVLFTLPGGGAGLGAALVLLTVEALPLVVLVTRVRRFWSLDATAPAPVPDTATGLRSVVLVVTTDEPEELLSSTVAAACRLRPVHQTWVLDGGARPWVARMCERYGARHVVQPDGTGAAGSYSGALNHALSLIERERSEEGEGLDVIAVLDADHVPLPTFLTATLGWFDDPRTAVVQAPQSFYNAGAFDDDGDTGEQGLLFHVVLPAEQHRGTGPDWYGSTALLRTRALVEIGGVVDAPAAEGLATTLALQRAGWRTRYHHQTLAVGMAPPTPERYLKERRRRALGSGRLLVTEGLWWPGKFRSWREYLHYLSSTAGWLPPVASLLALLVPVAVLLSGAVTLGPDVTPEVFGVAFALMLAARLGGAKLVFRGRLHWPTTAALNLLRVVVGLECLRWLVLRHGPHAANRRPKQGDRVQGQLPRLLQVLVVLDVALLAYVLLGLSDQVPWRLQWESVVVPGAWLGVASVALAITVLRIRDVSYATTRRVSYRVPVQAPVRVNGIWGDLVDVSVGGVAVRLPPDVLPEAAAVRLRLPATAELSLQIVRVVRANDVDEVSARVTPGDWDTYRELAVWLFHTPPGVVDGLPPGAPAVAAVDPDPRSRRPVLVREHVDPPAYSGALTGGPWR